MSGKQLAESLAWPPSKISKLENGRQTPTDEDIRSWTRETSADDAVDELLAMLHTMEKRHAQWRRLLSGGLNPTQHKLAEKEARVRFFRVFHPDVVPGLLQVPEYARACLGESRFAAGPPTDLSKAVETRMRRQEILYDQEKRFHFVLTEAALRYRYCSAQGMLAQLDRLMTLHSLPNVKLGVIGFGTTYPIGPWHGFWLKDENLVSIETYSAELNLAQPQEIELYSKVFAELAGIADYGRAARQIIMRVIDDLSAEVEEDPPTG